MIDVVKCNTAVTILLKPAASALGLHLQAMTYNRAHVFFTICIVSSNHAPLRPWLRSGGSPDSRHGFEMKRVPFVALAVDGTSLTLVALDCRRS